jgi:FMN-dependent NADH-azoreductase
MAGGRESDLMIPIKVLRIDASGRHEGSVSRRLLDAFLAEQAAAGIEALVTRRDLLESPPVPVDESWIVANNTPEDKRSAEQNDALRMSDHLVAELIANDIILVGLPIYNFQVPSSFKAWIDLVCRARKTFRYVESGPVGLLTGKRAIVVIASGGTKIGGPVDFVSGYVRHIFGFIGVRDVELVAADQLFNPGSESARLADVKLRELAKRYDLA